LGHHSSKLTINNVVQVNQLLAQNSNLRENGNNENEIVSQVCGSKYNSNEQGWDAGVECDEPARVLVGEKIEYGLGFE